jgi:hypothetical protein
LLRCKISASTARPLDCEYRETARPRNRETAIKHPNPLLHYPAPPMPSINELLGILIAIIVIWVVLKLAKVAIRLILFVITILLIAGVLYYVFMR